MTRSVVIQRRDLLKVSYAAAIGGFASVSACGMPYASWPKSFKRPVLSSPTNVVLTDDYLEENPVINLRGRGRDWIIQLPEGRYLRRPVFIDGHGEARHICIFGGGIRPHVPLYNPRTMRLYLTGHPAIGAKRGFVGATAGSFHFTICEKTYIQGLAPARTRDLPWNANRAQVKMALEAAAGPSAIFDVIGDDNSGGPWLIVPNNSPQLGRPRLHGEKLIGDISLIEENVFEAAHLAGLKIKDWTGIFHCEGVHIDGPEVVDGIIIQNPISTAVAQFYNVHSSPKFHRFHDDWIHGDGAQFYLGPSLARMENVDLVSVGGNGFIAQPFEVERPMKLQSIRDWSFVNCHFRAERDFRYGRLTDPSTSLYRSDGRQGRAARINHWHVHNLLLTRSITKESRRASVERFYVNDGLDQINFSFGETDTPVFFADPSLLQCGPLYRCY